MAFMNKIYESSFVAQMPWLENETGKLAAFLEEMGSDSPHHYGISLVFEEIATNIIKYGTGKDEEAQIHIELWKNEDSYVFKIVDDSHPFNPFEEAAQPDLEQALQDRAVGGLGIMLVKNFAKDVRYEYRAKKNHITVIF